jgi:hypothetical protein
MIRLLAVLALLCLYVSRLDRRWTVLLAPVRFGNLAHESLGILPEIKDRDWRKKMAIRVAGIGLISFAAHYAFSVAAVIRQT